MKQIVEEMQLFIKKPGRLESHICDAPNPTPDGVSGEGVNFVTRTL